MYWGATSESSLNKLTNKIGHFTILTSSKTYECNGIVRIENDSISLQCELGEADAITLDKQKQTFMIIGHVLAESVSFYSAYVIGRQTISNGKRRSTTVDFHFNFLVIGYAEKDPIKVHSISRTNSDINLFFPNSFADFGKLNEETILANLDSVKTEDKTGTITIYQTISETHTTSNACINFLTVVSCIFTADVDLEEAVHRIASVRNLLSFFFDGYIPLCSLSITTRANSTPSGEYIECDLIRCRSEKRAPDESVFYMDSDSLRENFDQVWGKWSALYESARPVTSLFYGIISGVSSGLNEFLNLSQSLEVYSNRFRDTEIRKALNKKKRDKIILSERLNDLIQLYNTYLGVIDTEILAKKLAKIRNYYTHYDKRLKEPSFSEVLAGAHVLRSLLLIVIFSDVGISSLNISRARKIGSMKFFDDYLNLLLGKQSASDRFLTL